MELLYTLQQIRVPALTKILSLLTNFGGLYGFMVLSLIVFWCIDKRCGYFMLSLGFLGTVINQFLKIVFHMKRPWLIAQEKNSPYPDFNAVESAKDGATGFSFPSGHTQNVFATFGGIFAWTKKMWLKILCVVMIVVVAFSRMYLGVHTPLDVGVSCIVGIVLLAVLYPVFRSMDEHPNRMYGFFAVLALLLLAFLLYSYLNPFTGKDYQGENYKNVIDARHNASLLTGALVGLVIAYTLDIKTVKFQTKAVWWAQILKVVVGLVGTVAITEGLKMVLGHSDLVTCVRYGIAVVFAAGVWPMTFGWFARLGRPQQSAKH